MASTLIKQPSENMLVDFDCSPILRSGETISSVISIDDKDSVLTYGSPSISGQIIQATVAGGVDKTTYKVTIKFATNLSPQREGDFYIVVRDL